MFTTEIQFFKGSNSKFLFSEVLIFLINGKLHAPQGHLEPQVLNLHLILTAYWGKPFELENCLKVHYLIKV